MTSMKGRKPRNPWKMSRWALEKMLITPEQNVLAGSVLRRSKENHFFYRMIMAKPQIEWKMPSEYCFCKCPSRILLIGQLLTNQMTFLYKKCYSLSNVENRKSPGAFVLELFNLQPNALFIEMNS